MGIKHAHESTEDEDTVKRSYWNDDHIIDGNVDFKEHESVNHVLENVSSLPSGVEGTILLYDSKIYYHNGSKWQRIGGP